MKYQFVRLMITGGESMVGSAIARYAKTKGIYADCVPHKECNLMHLQEIYERMHRFQPTYVIHAAGFNGGIDFNKTYPADIFYRTAQMGLNVLHACQMFRVKKVLSIISSCAYPDTKSELLSEENFWNGSCNPTVECHGFSKRLLDAFSRQITKQYYTRAISVVLNNCYGPGDNFSPAKGKVIGSLITKFHNAACNKTSVVECWGTGSPLREFVYSEDAGMLVFEALEKYDDTNLPLNLSTGQEISIKELAEKIATLVQFQGEIQWNTSKPDGQLRKRLDNTKMLKVLGNFPFTSIDDGLKKTIDWYDKTQLREY